jgi:Protein of unknown function (DUF1475)
MRAAMIVASLGAAALIVLIVQALVYGRFGDEGSILFALLWGRVTLADLYAGFALFSGWVLFRERSKARAVSWIALVLCLGNAFTLVYVAVALARSGGSWARFWLGDRDPTYAPRRG